MLAGLLVICVFKKRVLLMSTTHTVPGSALSSSVIANTTLSSPAYRERSETEGGSAASLRSCG